MDLSKRIASMDLLRGLAILGILFMNIVAFSAPEPAYMSPAWQGEPSMADKLAYSFQFMLANSRFYSLFCLLFGAGLVMFWQRAEFKGFDANALTKTRLHWLMLFGAVHLSLLFFGDILVSYAICGLIILGKVNWESDKLLRRGIIYIAISATIFSLIASMDLIDVPKEERMLPIPLSLDDANALINQATGSVLDMIWYNVKHGGVLVLAMPLMFWVLGGIMLLGMGLMKSDFFDNGLSNKREFSLFALGFCLSGVQLAMMWQTDFLSGFALMMPLNAVAAILLAVAVASRGAKLCKNNPNILMPLQYAGRMAFSLYIFQSLTMTLLFRWIRPDLFGQLARIEMLGVALVMTLAQLFIAIWWQTKIGQGPLEKMWRHLIYRNHQPKPAVEALVSE